jgi:SAM-dependent methyltransferase
MSRRREPARDATDRRTPDTPWQLRMYRKSLKKRQKVEMIAEMLGPLRNEWCLLVTGGDNNGAINHELRSLGGRWAWAEMEPEAVPAMEAFLGESVHAATPSALPFPDALFERVVVIDVHEHVADTRPLNDEIARVLAPGGLSIITTPTGDEGLPVARLKRWIGMHPRAYGHVVQGYTQGQLADMLRAAGLRVVGGGRWATEDRPHSGTCLPGRSGSSAELRHRRGGWGGCPGSASRPCRCGQTSRGDYRR